jgi:hypothetical protein
MVSRKHFDCSKVVCCERPASIASAPLVSVDWAHRGFMQMITVVTGIHSMPVMRIV